MVSANVLTDDAVQIHTVDGKQIIAITVPRATSAQRPVYIGTDPYSGSYCRCGEGDYRIPREEIEIMLTNRKSN
jgi:predicted HTH transcriptional regulator